VKEQQQTHRYEYESYIFLFLAHPPYVIDDVAIETFCSTLCSALLYASAQYHTTFPTRPLYDDVPLKY